MKNPNDATPAQHAFVTGCMVAISALILVYCLSAANRYLVNDDYQILYTAWLRSTGQVAGRDFSIYSYHLLVDLLEPLFVVFPRSLLPLWVGRSVMVATLVGVAWLIGSLGNRVFGHPAGYIAPVLALASHAMLYRALDLRPDLLTTLIWLAMLRLLLDDRLLQRRMLVLLGLLAGIVFLNRFKSALVFPIVALILAQRVREERSSWRDAFIEIIRVGSLVGAASLLPVALYAGWLSYHQELGTFLDVNFALAGVVETAVVQSPRPLRTIALVTSVHQDPLFWVLVVLGIVTRSVEARHFDARGNAIAAGTLLLAAASVVLNPAYYVYNLVTLVPLLSLFAAHPVALLLRERRSVPRGALAFVVLLTPLLTGWKTMAQEATDRTIAHQLALNQFIQNFTAPSTPIFAMEGIGLFRPSLYHWRMPEVLRPTYAAGEMDYAMELRQSPPEIIIVSYRLPAWLSRSDRAFFMSHYVLLTPLIAVQGFSGGGEQPTMSDFELLSSGRYEVLTTGSGSCRIDDLDVTKDDEPLALTAGKHAMTTSAETTCVVRWYFPVAARELISNPRQLPYLFSPELAPVAGG